MNPKTIDRFFRILAREFKRPGTLIVTGAAAGSLWGHVRPSQDIDFGVQLAGKARATWEQFQVAVNRTIEQTGIQVNYAEDIDRWGSITLLDYRRHTLPYRRFGALTVRLLDPIYWSIGKLGRYYALDVQDVVTVLKRQRVPSASLIRVWAKALRESPKSPALWQFRQQVEHFLRTYGREIWGRRFDAEAALRQFHRAAGIPRMH
ncbi:MAG: hypothetical protein HY737_07305 [Candidatus Omnitrophica bacterium]|nr:hypothetical protein [Candidatus Omnitrophota bacterium]